MGRTIVLPSSTIEPQSLRPGACLGWHGLRFLAGRDPVLHLLEAWSYWARQEWDDLRCSHRLILALNGVWAAGFLSLVNHIYVDHAGKTEQMHFG